MLFKSVAISPLFFSHYFLFASYSHLFNLAGGVHLNVSRLKHRQKEKEKKIPLHVLIYDTSITK